MYYISAYVFLMALLLYFSCLAMKPTSYYSTFPDKCLSQDFKDSDKEPVRTVCSRVHHKNCYNFEFSDEYPVGFKTTNLYSDIQKWLDY